MFDFHDSRCAGHERLGGDRNGGTESTTHGCPAGGAARVFNAVSMASTEVQLGGESDRTESRARGGASPEGGTRRHGRGIGGTLEYACGGAGPAACAGNPR